MCYDGPSEMADRFLMKLCSIEGCGDKSDARGMCPSHYGRWKRNGDPIGRKRLEKGYALRWLDDHVAWPDKEVCLIWTFHHNYKGYADWNGELIHRRMCKLAHGEPPTPKHHAAHSCGNGAGGCVNPNHLRWATPKENMADKLLHGKHNRGERSPKAKVSQSDVEEIRAIKPYYGYIQDIKSRYSIGEGGIRAIRTKRTWAWLNDGYDGNGGKGE